MGHGPPLTVSRPSLRAEVKRTADGASANSTTGGAAVTVGSAASGQETEANGSINIEQLKVALRSGGGGLIAIRSLLKGQAVSV